MHRKCKIKKNTELFQTITKKKGFNEQITIVHWDTYVILSRLEPIALQDL